jgi:hypothetical protein
MEDYSNLFFNQQEQDNKNAVTYNNMLAAQDNRLTSRIKNLQVQDWLSDRGNQEMLNMLAMNAQPQQPVQNQPNMLAQQAPQAQQAQPNPTNAPMDYSKPQGNMTSFAGNYVSGLGNPNMPPAATGVQTQKQATPQGNAPPQAQTGQFSLPAIQQQAQAINQFMAKAKASGDAKAYAFGQQKLAELNEQTKAEADRAGKLLKELKEGMGLNNLKKNWNNLKSLHPLFSLIDMDASTAENTVINGPDGKPFGMMITKNDGSEVFEKFPVDDEKKQDRIDQREQMREDSAEKREAMRIAAQERRESRKEAFTLAHKNSDARMDKSYQFNSTHLEKVEKPILDASMRIGRLITTIDQATPAADALVAPEMLTVMAGGQGSGMRMNEAEIARIVGGRTNFETLKAKLNKWQADPSKGLSITPAQRQQMKKLIVEVDNKLTQKRNTIDQANQDLINAESVEDHRKIVANAKKAITDIDAGKPINVPVRKAPKQGDKLTDKELAGAYMKAANGDKEVARKLAKTDGWSF